MIVASSAVCRSISLAAAFCLAVWSITGVFRHARGAEDIGPSLPPAVENLLRWFPVDTETMVVAQSFKIRRPRNDKNTDFAVPIWDRLQDLSLCGLSELEGGAGLDELLDREVSVAINGARNFTIVSAFGSLRYEGCGIVRFKEPLPDAGRRLMDALRKKAKAVRTLAGTVRWARLTDAKPSELIVFERWGEGGPVALRGDGTKLWEQSGGEGIDDVWAADLDGDGKDEIIVGYNGSTGLHVFNADGSLRWKDTSIGNVWRVTAADIDGGELEVLAASGKVYVFKADGGKIATLDVGIQATMVRAFRPPGESTDHLLAVGSNSREAWMVPLNGKGERLWQTELRAGVNMCASLAVAPGSKWAAAGSMGSVVWVTDVATGKILGARPKLGFPRVAWVNGADDEPLLLVASTHGLAAFRVSESGSTGRKK